MDSEYKDLIGQGLVSTDSGVYMGEVTDVDSHGIELDGGPGRIHFTGKRKSFELFYKAIELKIPKLEERPLAVSAA